MPQTAPARELPAAAEAQLAGSLPEEDRHTRRIPASPRGCTSLRGCPLSPHQASPVDEGLRKTSLRLMMWGCDNRRRMHTSRSTRFAFSALFSTSGMRFSATCTRQWQAAQGWCTASMHNCCTQDTC